MLRVWLIINNLYRLGADHIISYKENPDYSSLVKEYTNGKGVNVILDPILASNFEYVRFILTYYYWRMYNQLPWMEDGLYMGAWVDSRFQMLISLRY